MRLIRANLRTGEARQLFDALSVLLRMHGREGRLEISEGILHDSHVDEVQITTVPENANMLIRTVTYKSEPERIVRMLNNNEPCSAWSVDKDIQECNLWYIVEEKKSD